MADNNVFEITVQNDKRIYLKINDALLLNFIFSVCLYMIRGKDLCFELIQNFKHINEQLRGQCLLLVEKA